jgi:hypothetical protein
MTGIKETPTHIYAKGDGYVVRVKGEHRGKYETLEKPSPPVTRSMMAASSPVLAATVAAPRAHRTRSRAT